MTNSPTTKRKTPQNLNINHLKLATMSTIFNYFQDLTLTDDQHNALEKIEKFLSSDTPIFILKGYAGSGKTTLLKGLVIYL